MLNSMIQTYNNLCKFFHEMVCGSPANFFESLLIVTFCVAAVLAIVWIIKNVIENI